MGKILTDIMGTITPNSFLKAMMGDFREHGAGFISNPDEQARAIIDKIRASKGDITAEQMVAVIDDVIARRDFSDPLLPDYLKLTGAVNVQGYNTERMQAPFYEDVPQAFSGWKKNGKGIFVYSNGSEASQRAMFRTGDRGDLTPFVTRFFDTADWGSKDKDESYKRIADAMQEAPKDIVFFSDLTRELDPASRVGYEVFLVNRPGNIPQTENGYRKINSLLEAGI